MKKSIKELKKIKLRKKIEKVEEEIKEILTVMYALDEKDSYDNFVWAREGMIRSCVIEFQLSIEDLIDQIITTIVYRVRKDIKRKKVPKKFVETRKFKEILKDIHRMDFFYKIRIAERLGVISKMDLDKLDKLRDVRNKCGHYLILSRKIFEKKGKGKKRRIKPFLEFNGRNLLSKEVFLRDFIPEYGPIYLKLFNKTIL